MPRALIAPALIRSPGTYSNYAITDRCYASLADALSENDELIEWPAKDAMGHDLWYSAPVVDVPVERAPKKKAITKKLKK